MIRINSDRFNDIMNKIIRSFKSIDYRLFWVLLLMGLIPTVYTTVRILFLGQMPDSYGFSIAAQLQWVNLLYEILQEAFILPLYFLIGKVLIGNQSDKSTEFTNRVKTGLIIVFGVYTGLSVVIMVFAEPMIRFMHSVLGLDNYNDIFLIVIISIGFYVLFAYNNVIDSIFYGIGKTKYMLIQSLVINSLFYGIVFILYLTGIYKLTLILISLMFACGTALDSILTFYIFQKMCKKEKITIMKD